MRCVGSLKNHVAIIAHGGAGGISYPHRRRSGLVNAVRAGYGMLIQGGSSLDVVEKVSMILEDNKIFNAGTGSSFTLNGEVEMDASIMTSDSLYGAVAAIKDVKNPIRVARLVMEKTDHLLLGGEGAIKFARLMGIKAYNPKTRERKLVWQRAKSKLRSDYFGKIKELNDLYGTIGVVAIDKNGSISAATSSGGITLRLPGRIGDTPVIGAGTYADMNGGVSATGHGEEIMRHILAFRTVSLMAYYSARKAGEMIINYATKHDCRCGLIGIDMKGRILCVNNTEAMSWCYIKNSKTRVF